MSEPTVRVEIKPPPADVWVTLADVDADVELRWRRGIDGNTPTDVVAHGGELECAVRNDRGNSAGIQGYYSPFHPFVRPGFAEGTPIRVVHTVGDEEAVRWTGRIKRIDPETGEARGKRSFVAAADCMADLAENDIRAVALQRDKTEVELLDALLDALPADAQPLARDFDAAVESFSVAFHELESGVKGLGVAQKIMLNSQGYLFPLGDGTLRYQNRVQRSIETPRFAFGDDTMAELEPASGVEGNVWNRVRITIVPKLFDESPVVLFRAPGVIAVEPGATEDFWISYRDPENPTTLIGGDEFVDPLEAGVDYVGNAQADGLGADLTADLDVDVDFFASTAVIHIENTGAATVYLPANTLQIRGIGIYALVPVTREAYAEARINRPITIELAYQDDAQKAFEQAVFLLASFRALTHRFQALEFEARASDALLQQALRLEIGQVITLTEAMTGAVAVSSYIQALECRISPARWVVRLELGPRVSSDVRHTDELFCHDTLVADATAGGGGVVDTARVDMAAVA